MAVMRSSVFWDITLCSPLNVSRHFGGILLFGLFFDPEGGGDMFLRTLGEFQRATRRYISEDRTRQVFGCPR
jgi:hypothetical protein